MHPLNRLVERARDGDLDAFGDVVKATQTMAFALAVHALRDLAGAQDVVQDAYLSAFRRLRDLDDPAAPRPTPRSAPATASSGWRCCATGSTTSARWTSATSRSTRS